MKKKLAEIVKLKLLNLNLIKDRKTLGLNTKRDKIQRKIEEKSEISQISKFSKKSGQTRNFEVPKTSDITALIQQNQTLVAKIFELEEKTQKLMEENIKLKKKMKKKFWSISQEKLKTNPLYLFNNHSPHSSKSKIPSNISSIFTKKDPELVNYTLTNTTNCSLMNRKMSEPVQKNLKKEINTENRPRNEETGHQCQTETEKENDFYVLGGLDKFGVFSTIGGKSKKRKRKQKKDNTVNEGVSINFYSNVVSPFGKKFRRKKRAKSRKMKILSSPRIEEKILNLKDRGKLLASKTLCGCKFKNVFERKKSRKKGVKSSQKKMMKILKKTNKNLNQLIKEKNCEGGILRCKSEVKFGRKISRNEASFDQKKKISANESLKEMLNRDIEEFKEKIEKKLQILGKYQK